MKKSIHQKHITILSVDPINNRASKYIKKQVTELKGKETNPQSQFRT